MEGYGHSRRKLQTASYYKSGMLTLGASLFGISQILRFIQLFRDAAARKAANQAPPENYTAAGITWSALIIVLILGICILLLRNRQGKLRMRKGRAYTLLSLLFVLWGVYYVITFTTEMIRNSELTLLFDIAAIGAGLVAPVLLLEIADIAETMVDDSILLICSIGGVVLSIVSIIMLIILRKGYANAQLLLVTEFLFRIALLLSSLAALLKAIQIRNSYPVVEEVRERPAKKRVEAKKPARKKQRFLDEDDAPFTLRFGDEDDDAYDDDDADFEDEAPVKKPIQHVVRERAQTVGKQAERQVHSLRSYAEQGYDDEEPAPKNRVSRDTERYAYAAQQTSWGDTGRIIVQGGTGRIATQDPGSVPAERQTCPYCGKRMPKGFPNCPRCGRDM